MKDYQRSMDNTVDRIENSFVITDAYIKSRIDIMHKNLLNLERGVDKYCKRIRVFSTFIVIIYAIITVLMILMPILLFF